MNNWQHLYLPGKINYGQGALAQLGNEAALLGTKALIVSDPIMYRIGVINQCLNELTNKSIASVTFTGVHSEPTDEYVTQGLALCREEECDFIIAVGGGSCIDTAKAIAIMMTNTGYIGDYQGIHRKFLNRPIPLIAIPTTAGTGSEVTKVTVIIDTRNQVKMMISQPELLPRIAIVDPQLTVTCPPNITAATGMDALCHAIEAYLSCKAHVFTDNIALGAIALIIKHLPVAYQHGHDVNARQQMAIGSMMAGVAFSNSSVTLVHGMSRPIGAVFHVPHGISNAMLLPAVLEFTRPAAETRMADIGRAVWPELAGLSDKEISKTFIAEIKRLCRILHIPNMKGWGIDADQFTRFLHKMASDAIASGSPGNNPRVPTHQELMELYLVCFDYSVE